MKLSQDIFNLTLSLLVAIVAFAAPTAGAQSQAARVLVHSINGNATCSSPENLQPQPLKAGSNLAAGTVIKTAPNATVDLLMADSGTVLRLLPGSALRFDRLLAMPAIETAVTTTRLTLLSGVLLGSQRKLARPSVFEVKLSTGVAKIVGTEYLVGADGAVTCLNGKVSVTCKPTVGSQAIQVAVPAGASFNPATGRVAATAASCLQNVSSDLQAVRDCAQTFKIGREPAPRNHCHDDISPNHDHDHDHDRDHDHDDDHGHDGHDSHDGHGDKGH